MVGMKDIAAITTRVKKHMRSHMYDIEPAWPFPVPVGLPDQAFLETNAIAVHDNNNEIRQWASKNGCEIITKHRTIGTSVELISKVVVPDESIAMRVVGRTLAAEYREAHRRIACLVAACDVAPETIESAARMTGHEQPDDFDLLVSAVRYFRHHDVTGMTPRQIPLTGFSGKWLNESKPIVVRPFADCSVSKRWVCQNGRPNCGSVISIRSATMLSSNASYGVRGKAKRYPALNMLSSLRTKTRIRLCRRLRRASAYGVLVAL